MKLIRLPSGPLACVYPVEESQRSRERGAESGVFRAFSGSVQADGASEEQAIEALDECVRRLSVPPPAEITDFELSRAAANVTPCRGPGLANTTGTFPRFGQRDTQPAPASSRR
ncbi:MAG TPA: hypothetical protein VIW29_18690 [Polyangiaceae bacterium]